MVAGLCPFELYLAVVINIFSRKVVGWAMASRLYAELVLSASIWRSRTVAPAKDRSTIATSGQAREVPFCLRHGSQHPSFAFGERSDKSGILGTMGSVSDVLDNAVAESFFSTLQVELSDHRKWATRSELRLAIFDYVEVFYSRQRLHSTLGYLSPTEFEMKWRPTAAYCGR